MSLERACVNCERCFYLANSITLRWDSIERKHKSEVKKELYENDQVYQARNEAMKALEDVDNKLYLEMALAGSPVSGYDPNKVDKALKACGSCTYDEPRIVEVVKKGRTYSQTEKKQE